ncbi:MAG TPA: cytochrome C oxidase subunit IV family protein [Sporichthyaceae bacterium]|jgi:hypothetical protein|nr:cytochrome C oxidase subunit IV family protein [Sporichthyaceae bacterium]
MISRDRVLLVWAVLVLATITSLTLSAEDLIDRQDVVAIAVIVIAFVKVRLVGMHFMELRAAPKVLQLAFQGWCVVACSVLAGLYLAF